MSLTNLICFVKSHLAAKKAFKLQPNQISSNQNRQLQRLIKHTLQKSPFYQPFCHQQFNDKHLTAFPVLDKAEHLANFNAINTAGLDRDQAYSIAQNSEETREFLQNDSDIAVGLSSGTSGKRGLFVTCGKERAQWAGYITAKMIRSIWHARRIAFFLRSNNELYESVKNLWVDFRFYDLHFGLNTHLKALDQFSPLILIAPAQILLLIAKAQRDLPDFSISPQQIVSVAEVLEPQDKDFIEKTFDLKVDQIYQCTEGFLACTCPNGSLHLNEDAVIIEKQWLDKDSGRFMPVITDLRRHTQPVIRYRLDDVLVLDPEPCNCGSAFTRLRQIEGRCDDMLVVSDANNKHQLVFADTMRQTMLLAGKLQNYRIIQPTPDSLKLFIMPFDDELQIEINKHMDRLFRDLQLTMPQVSFASMDEFPQTDLSAKQRRIMRKFPYNLMKDEDQLNSGTSLISGLPCNS